MKKFAVLLMTAVMLTALTGCGGKNEASNGDGSGESKYAEAIEILDAVFGVYEEADKFAVYGGNQADGSGIFYPMDRRTAACQKFCGRAGFSFRISAKGRLSAAEKACKSLRI